MHSQDQESVQLRAYSADEESRTSFLEITENLSSTPEEPEGLQPNGHPAINWLLISHFLSTWNSRVFEFSAILFLAVIFPGSLLPASLYALARSGTVIILAPTIGRYIDSTNRLWTVRYSIGKSLDALLISVLFSPKTAIWVLNLSDSSRDIVGQRLATATSCLLFLLLYNGREENPMAKKCFCLLCCLRWPVWRSCAQL